MKTAKRQIGDLGEEIAAKFYEKRGFPLIERNYLKPWGELDLVLRKGDLIVFAEVKSACLPVGKVSHEKDGSRETTNPAEKVHPKKLERLYRTIQSYLLERNIPERVEWRLDVVCVHLDIASRKAKVEVIENVVA